MALEDLELLKTTIDPGKLEGYNIHWYPENLTIDCFNRGDQDSPLTPERVLLWLWIKVINGCDGYQPDKIDIIIDYFRRFKPTHKCFKVTESKCDRLDGRKKWNEASYQLWDDIEKELEKIDE